MKFAALLLFTLSAVFCANGQTINLKPHFPIGKKLTYITKIEQENQVKMPNMPAKNMKQSMNQEQTYTITFRKDKTGNIESEIVCKSIKMENKVGTMSFSFDSTKKGQDKSPMAIMKKFVNQKFTVTYAKDGSVKDVKGIDTFLKSLPPNPLMAKMFNKESIKSMFNVNFFNQGLQKRTIKKGDVWKWNYTFPTPMGGNNKADLTYTFVGMKKINKNKCAELLYTGKINMDFDQEKSPMGLKMEVKNGHMEGRSYFDTKLGIIIKSITNQAMDMNMTLPAQPNSKIKMPQNMSSKIRQKIINEVTKIESI